MGADEFEQMMLRGDPTTVDDIVQMTAKPANFWDSKNYSAATKDGIVLQPVYGTTSSGHGEEGQKYEYGPVTGVKRYKEGQTKPGQTYEVLDPATGKVVGKGVFEEQSKGFFGDAWSGLKTVAADLGPILQFTPLAPFVRAISALSAAEQGNVLGALASGLPLADKIPGLDKATVTALQNAGKYASVASAAKSKDPAQLLNALSQTPEFGGKYSQELKDIGKYVSSAGALQRAAKGDIGAIMSLMPGASKGAASGQAASAGYGGADQGFYDEEAEDADSYIRSLMNYEAALPQDMSTGSFSPGSDDVYEDIENLLARYTDQGFADTSLGDAGQTITTTGQKDNTDIDPWLQPFLDTAQTTTGGAKDDAQTVTVTGTRQTTSDTTGIAPTGEVPDRTPGSPTDTTPRPPTPDDDRTSGTAPSGGTKTTGGAKTTTKPGMSTEDLMKLLLAMQGQQPEQEEEYRLANIQPLGYDLMYGLKG